MDMLFLCVWGCTLGHLVEEFPCVLQLLHGHRLAVLGGGQGGEGLGRH